MSMPNIHITVVAYALDLDPLVRDLHGLEITWHCYLHSQNEEVAGGCEYIAEALGEQFIYHPYGVNRGLARSWNDGLIESAEMGATVMMIANDDIVASYADVLRLADAATRYRDYGFIECMGVDQRMGRRQPMAFALCAVNPIAIETIGYMDENLFPYGFEDSDYARRAGLEGVKWLTLEDVNIVHVGSATVAASPTLARQNQITFNATKAYYVQKWGGEPGAEQYSVPFDDPTFDLRIDESVRNAPYYGYNRTDTEIVRI